MYLGDYERWDFLFAASLPITIDRRAVGRVLRREERGANGQIWIVAELWENVDVAHLYWDFVAFDDMDIMNIMSAQLKDSGDRRCKVFDLCDPIVTRGDEVIAL